MARQKRLPAAMLAVLAAAALVVSVFKATADECRTRPGLSAVPGKHWYYHVNRSDHQPCWYLGSAETEQGSHARGVTSIVHRPLIRYRATEQPDGDQQTTPTHPRSEEVTVRQSRGHSVHNGFLSLVGERWKSIAWPFANSPLTPLDSSAHRTYLFNRRIALIHASAISRSTWRSDGSARSARLRHSST